MCKTLTFLQKFKKKEKSRNFLVISIVKGEFQNDIDNNKKCKVKKQLQKKENIMQKTMLLKMNFKMIFIFEEYFLIQLIKIT